MSIQSDRWIIEQAKLGMITPFVEHQVKEHLKVGSTLRSDNTPIEHNERVISYGVSSYGYDIRAADDWKVFTNINSTLVDPKNFNESSFISVSGKGYCIIPPNSFALARSFEYFKMPRGILAICLGKSTYARCGISVHITPLEPEWEGELVLEFSNTTPLPAKIYSNEGVAQLLFLRANEDCLTSYADRSGKYQNQSGVTFSKV